MSKSGPREVRREGPFAGPPPTPGPPLAPGGGGGCTEWAGVGGREFFGPFPVSWPHGLPLFPSDFQHEARVGKDLPWV